MAEKKTIKIKILVNKKTEKLVFAESDKEFVEILLSFLTLPISTIIRLAPKKKSDLGSMDSLYGSVGTLKNHFFETPGCRSMLLNPKTPFEGGYKSLAVDYYTSTLQNQFFLCPSSSCVTDENHCLVSMIKNVKCICGKKMNRACVMEKWENVDGLFVKGVGRFIISDDLCVREVCTESDVSALKEFGVNGVSVEEKIVFVGVKEVLKLLHRSLISKTPMSDVFLPKQKKSDTSAMNNYSLGMISQTIPKSVSDKRMVSLILLVRKASGESLLFPERREEKVVYATAKGDFIDFLLSILTFPVGSIMKLVNKTCHVGSVTSLFGSVQKLCEEGPEKFKECEEKLLNAKIFRHYDCEKPLLKMEVNDWLYTHHVLKCGDCSNKIINIPNDKLCKHGLRYKSLRLVNPKFADTVCEGGGGFIKKDMVFKVTDDLKIEPLSRISFTSLFSVLGVPLSELEERIVTITEHEALSILKASLTSKTVLTDVFCNRKKGKPSAYECLNVSGLSVFCDLIYKDEF